ncbi:hypothetical protein E4413_20155 [Leptospira interrogans]|nr:hypothetical protein C5473_20090 [Leptospira interrogans serovar Weerasinghe]KAA1293717.1 hypothetical protein C4X99_01145 [Leptospira interrogans serovar Geyaweera]QCO35352.1 hypothetical protein E4414_20270 [Leptospira interrogans]QCO39345.1 hypothetical protein E4412_19670 [Leptospira interrogans]QCO43178.1 hypothetical protein E4413_20155 [Leptospira interrogans]
MKITKTKLPYIKIKSDEITFRINPKTEKKSNYQLYVSSCYGLRRLWIVYKLFSTIKSCNSFHILRFDKNLLAQL